MELQGPRKLRRHAGARPRALLDLRGGSRTISVTVRPNATRRAFRPAMLLEDNRARVPAWAGSGEVVFVETGVELEPDGRAVVVYTVQWQVVTPELHGFYFSGNDRLEIIGWSPKSYAVDDFEHRYGLSITKRAIPVVARLMAHLTRGLMPVEVDGDVQWLLNKTRTGWAVTLLNPAGQWKPQQGIAPTDFRQNRMVTIRSRVPIQAAHDRMLTSERLIVKNNTVSCEVTAGGVRVISLK